MLVQPYLSIEGRCAEAVEFYVGAVDAQVEMLMRFRDSPEPPPPECAPVDGDKVMHCALRIGDSVVMATDGQGGAGAQFQGFSLSLTVADAAEAQRRFDALAAGGQVTMPLAPTFFARSFGMLTDRFGVSWMVMAPAPMPG
jgi:PhnB protein